MWLSLTGEWGDLVPFNLSAAIPAKERGKASLFLCCAKATLLLAPKGENRDLPLWNPPSRHVQRESLTCQPILSDLFATR
ncbi:MAG: hypothetical protein A3E85_03265 [Gammaproteobacteria bacterium RIFCSPHIGHO2_12_FULL_45_12]|nr:MAG: hypothetical protein A3E85_03265 [Gammaproteobacteria bacterium RIFCSPHIGHO2_12_FULL_45_12]